MKLKDKGTVNKTLKLIANGLQFLNGSLAIRHFKTPVMVLDYTPPPTAKPYAKGERLALWFKLENRPEIQKQLKPGLRELTIWFTEEEQNKLRRFLNG